MWRVYVACWWRRSVCEVGRLSVVSLEVFSAFLYLYRRKVNLRRRVIELCVGESRRRIV